MMTVRENMRLAYEHKKTQWVPFAEEETSPVVIPALGDAPRPDGKGAFYDGYGVKWLVQENVGNMVDETVPPVVPDVEEWKKYLKFPDLDAFDWEKGGAETNERWQKEDKFRAAYLFNGMWERMYFLCGFEDALCALLEYPDEAAELLSAMADFRVRSIGLIGKYYRPDKIIMHDDYGFDEQMMMSADTWREIIKPNLKRIVAACHENGIFYEHHSCGFTAPIVPDLVEIGVDALQPVHIKNHPAALKKAYGKDICIMGGFDIQGVYCRNGATYDEAYADVIKTLHTLAPGGSYILQNPIAIKGDTWQEVDRAIHDALSDYNKGKA